MKKNLIVLMIIIVYFGIGVIYGFIENPSDPNVPNGSFCDPPQPDPVRQYNGIMSPPTVCRTEKTYHLIMLDTIIWPYEILKNPESIKDFGYFIRENMEKIDFLYFRDN